MSLVENLYRDYEGFHVEIPRWEISDLGVTALMGPSGSGKTSVFRLLIGLEKCPGMSWKFGDTDLNRLPIRERRLGVVFQNYELFPHMTAFENIEFAARSRGVSGDDFRFRLKKMSEALRMGEFLDRSVSVLSGGERQRTALVRALIGRPRFLLLDEPFSALDDEIRNDSRVLVRNLLQEEGVPALLVTHDSKDVEKLADHVQMIQAGRLKG